MWTGKLEGEKIESCGHGWRGRSHRTLRSIETRIVVVLMLPRRVGGSDRGTGSGWRNGAAGWYELRGYRADGRSESGYGVGDIAPRSGRTGRESLSFGEFGQLKSDVDVLRKRKTPAAIKVNFHGRTKAALH